MQDMLDSVKTGRNDGLSAGSVQEKVPKTLRVQPNLTFENMERDKDLSLRNAAPKKEVMRKDAM